MIKLNIPGYNAHTNVSRVVDGAEPMEFKALFKAWRDKYENTGIGKKYSGQYDHSQGIGCEFF